MRHVIRLLAAWLVVLLAVRAAGADEPSRFLIERIDVRNLAHASPDVIKSESRLREGESYSEEELRDANNRIKRLPFVLDAAFSLERGSVRGAYVLVITVNETRPFFYAFDLVLFKDQSSSVFTDSETPAVLGLRWFAGRRGAFHLAALDHKDDRPFESQYVNLQAGYTQYGLFGGRAFGTVTLNHYRYSSGPTGSGKTLPGALLGISLTPKQTLTISWSDVDIGATANRRHERVFESRLAYNTTNHPFFPSAGTLVSIAPVVAWTRVDRYPAPAAVHSFVRGIDGHIARYWPLNERSSFAAVIDGGSVLITRRTGGQAQTIRTEYGSSMLKWSRILGDPASTDVEKRLEIFARGFTAQKRDFLPFITRAGRTEVGAAWVRRTAWGYVRLGLGYGWNR